MIATLARTHGLRAATVRKPDLSEAALVCVSCLEDASNPAVAKEAQRIRTAAPHAKIILGVWGAADDTAVASMKGASGADMAFRSFQTAAAAMLGEADHDNSGEEVAQVAPAPGRATGEAECGPEESDSRRALDPR